MNPKRPVSFPNELLLSWYDAAKRDLPWRGTDDPYRIWMSEIILQQTRVDQGLPYYERFIAAFPSVADLANASEDEVLKLWEGLGYYSRARNLHATAKNISQNFEGQFPNTYQGLLELKGVGPYTAAAIGSIAFNLPVAVVGGNVYRVLARYCGIEDSIDDSKTKNLISRLAQDILSMQRPGDHNQAMMELGATVCTPKQVQCVECPLRSYCVAFQEGNQSELPVRTKRTKVRTRYFYYAVHVVDGQVPIARRGNGDIWNGLYEFPLFESDKRLDEPALLKLCGVSEGDVIVSISEEFKHVLTHQRIYAWFVLVKPQRKQRGDLTWVSMHELRTFAFPRLINRYLENSNFVIDEEVFNI